MKIDLKNYKEIIFLIIIPLFFLYKMVFYGEIITTNDEYERHPINEWRDNYFVDNKEIPQWFPNIFSGMPSYGGYIYNNGDPTKFIRNDILFNPGLKIWFYLSISGIGFFVFLRLIGVSKKSALFGGLISALTPYSFGLINAGHLNKIFAMAYIPWVLTSAFYLIKKHNLKSILFLSISTALQLWVNHPQIAYYTWMVLGFYFCWDTVLNIKKGKFSSLLIFLKFSAIIFSLFIALIMVSDPYFDIYEFQKESNRGSRSVLDQTNQTEKGASWNYATQWSFHPKEIISFFYPYHYGLQNIQDLKKGAYWGFMSFTQSTHYLGLIVIILAILGPLLKKPDKLEIFFWLVTFFTLFTGFGAHFPILYKPFFNILPFFSKFRIPSMIYILLAFSLPVLAARGLDILIYEFENKNFSRNVFLLPGLIVLSTLILLLFGESIINFNHKTDSFRYSVGQISILKNYRIDLFHKGLILALFISGCFLSLVFLFKKNHIKKNNFFYLLLLLGLFDLWFINNEFMNLKPKKDMDKLFKSNPIINRIKQDKSHFRIYPADELGSNKYSYWNIESIGGYRPIKLRSYEDLMSAKGFSKPQILNMLNVKYVITSKKIKNSNFTKVVDINGLYINNKVLPKAWLVGDIKNVFSQRESLMETLLTGFDPSKKAIVVNYDGPNLSDNISGKIDLKEKKENSIKLESDSPTGGLLVLSEIYYEPGWKAFINGIETKIFQTNHILRSIYIPKGKNEILFKYNDAHFNKIRTLSRVSFFLVLTVIGILFRNKINFK